MATLTHGDAILVAAASLAATAAADNLVELLAAGDESGFGEGWALAENMLAAVLPYGATPAAEMLNTAIDAEIDAWNGIPTSANLAKTLARYNEAIR